MPQPTRQKMTRSEAARHAALVRYGKRQALAKPTAANVQARAAEILAKLRAKGQPKPKAAGKGKAKPKGKAAKPKESRTPQEKANQNRAAVAKQGGMDKLEGVVVRLGAGMNSDLEKDAHKELIDKGLATVGADGKPKLSPAGKKWKAAADKGNVEGANAALAEGKQSASESAAKEKAKGEKQAEREKVKAERAAARAAKQAERIKAAQERKKKSGSRKKPKEKAEPKEDFDGVAAEAARIDAAVRRTTKTETGMPDQLEEQIDQLVDVLEYFTTADTEVKAGARHSSKDTTLINQGYALAEELCSLFESLGATVEDEEEETDEDDAPAPMEGKGIEIYGNDLAALPGYAVKATGEGWTSGYLVKFGGDGDLSNWRDVFGKETDYGRATKSDVWVHHRMLPGVGKRRLTNQADIGIDDEGVFIKHLLDLRSGYEAKLYGLVTQGKLGWSSGTAPHLVDRKAMGDGRHQIEQWPLGLDASYTPTPAGGLVVNAGAMKSLLEENGIDLLSIIHEASIAAESGVKSIDTDSSEAAIEDSERHDGAKAEHERARILLLRSRIIALQE